MPIDLDAIKNRIDLAQLFAARGIDLAPRGANLAARCPFHEDHKASLIVNPKRQLWNCFGCSAAGDAISFVERMDGISFKEAASRLAREAGVLASGSNTASKTAAPGNGASAAASRDLSRRVLERVAVYYKETLTQNKEAHEYLRTRGLTDSLLLARVRAGFADGSLSSLVKKQPAMVGELRRRGLLNQRGNEFFHSCLVFPIADSSGHIVNLYGRNTRPETEIPHLYLPGPRKGVFNHPGVKGAGSSIILTEGVIDALSLIQLGFANTTCTWGTNGFTADLFAALQRHRVETVFVAYDDDLAGNASALKLAQRLGPHGIQTRRVMLPTKDPNDFLIEGRSADEFRRLLEKAIDLTPEDYRRKPMQPAPELVAPAATTPCSAHGPMDEPHMESAPTTATPIAVEPSAPHGQNDSTPSSSCAGAAAEPPPALPPNTLVTRFGPRTYRVTLPRAGSTGLRVMLRLEADARSLLDRFDLASDRARSAFVSRAVKLLGAPDRGPLEEDLFHLIDQIEERQLKKEAPDTPSTPSTHPMSHSEEAAALAFLKSPQLLDELLKDLEGAGLVGENTNKLLLYLVATSRLLERPLSAVLLSGSSAGKSHLIKTVADLMPPESLFRYTRISAAALFYKEREALKHKLVVIEEAEGASDADYPLRVMQSDRTLTNLVTIKDPVTGQMTTQETEVEGPISLLVSSTAAAIHYENSTRSFELAIDESPEQTAEILAAQRRARKIEGIAARRRMETIRTRHHNAQRLLTPIEVSNPYSELLSFPTSPLRLRREHEKYLTLIEVITFLHQHQRARKRFTLQGESEPIVYIETTRSDIRTANRLFAAVVSDTIGELSRQSRELLDRLQSLLAKKTMEAPAASNPKDYATPPIHESIFDSAGLSRREIREALDWSDYQLRICLEQLEELEYVIATNGRQGKRYVYALTPKGRLAGARTDDPDELARRFGLTDPDSLPDTLP